MRETVLEFGPARRLIGILSRPEPDAPKRDVAVVITNSGIIHRCGANRLHVRLARAFACHGYTTLRYDLPGVGDSEVSGAGAGVQQEQIAGTMAALDALQKSGIATRFVMVGLCSGADHSFVVSFADPRVAGAVMIDPTAMFSTRRHRLNRVLQTAKRGLRPHVWWRLIRGRYHVTQKLRHAAAETPAPGTPRLLDASHDADAFSQTTAAFESFIDRGTRLCLIITRHNREIYSYRRQIFDTLPDLPQLESLVKVKRFPRTEHTFSAEEDRNALEAGILSWLAEAMTPVLVR